MYAYNHLQLIMYSVSTWGIHQMSRLVCPSYAEMLNRTSCREEKQFMQGYLRKCCFLFRSVENSMHLIRMNYQNFNR